MKSARRGVRSSRAGAEIRRVVVVSYQQSSHPQEQIEAVEASNGLWKSLASTGIEVLRFVPASNHESAVSLAALSEPGFSVRPFPLRFSGGGFSIAKNMSHMLRDAKPDVVHVIGEPWQVGVLTTVRGARSLAPLVGVHFCENGPAFHGTRGGIRRWLSRWCFRRVAYAFAWSSAGADLAQSISGGATEVETLPAVGVPDGYFRGPSPRDERDGIVFVGRLVPEKGVLEVLALAQMLGGDTRVRIIGRGPLQTEVQKAARAGLVEYEGSRPRHEVVDAMAKARVTLVPSLAGWIGGATGRVRWEEQFGRVIAESMAVGTPVVGYSTGAISEVMGPGGISVPPNDRPALYRAARSLLDDSDTWDLRSSQGRLWAERFRDSELAAQTLRAWTRYLQIQC